MSEPVKIVEVEQPDWHTIGGGISEYNTEKAGPDNGRNLCFLLQDASGETIGGIIGATHWNWFYINLMWIREDFRNQGYGSQLMARAEEEARHRGAEYAYLDTFSFQAPDFYRRHGYEVFGELADFPPGHRRLYLKKKL